MCGLIAWVTAPDTRPPRKRLLEASKCMRYRGPDDSGVWIEDNVALAHRRLSILDLSERGRQPMVHPPTGWRIIYNGEIYNHQALRRQLTDIGYSFRSKTDTEVLLKGWVEWSETLFDRLNGMYSLVFYGPRKNSLYVLRDLFGAKPLYLSRISNQLMIASEIKSILTLRQSPPEIDPQGLNEYLTFQNFLSNRTLIDGIQTIKPGTLYEYDTQRPDASPVETELDNTVFTGDFSGTRSQAVNEIEETLRESVSRHLIGDVPVNCYLSGGIDSSTICALANQNTPNRLKTFTIGFDTFGVTGKETQYDERSQARIVADAIDSDHYEDVVTANTLREVMSKLVYHLEEPRAGQSYPNFMAAKLASEHGKVVLSGTGGDELFGGYPWRYQIAWKTKNHNRNKQGLYELWERVYSVEERKGVIPDNLHGQIDFDQPRERFFEWIEGLPYDLSRVEEFLNACLHIETSFFLKGLLHVEDKLGMGFGLEARFPFLDRELFALAQQIPGRWKVDPFHKNQTSGEYRRLENGKVILRVALDRIVPDSIQRRSKQGFSGPYEEWQEHQQAHYLRKAVQRCSFLDEPKIKSKNRLVPWSLLYLSIFEDTFLIDGTNEFNNGTAKRRG